ncbi:hypothetical protein ACFFMR_19010 [Micromonospora andamanensis]|uniref:Uncharacterized protein n=1 Tax=Micromonospora andamanensis TaxID=1287068 RepID=A0ABQ4HYM8_9ACTN|nr:hypothetical protein [Micromonospora andamanensis]GIJ10758.1 hypothetical protein Van01_39720 [Micromonospora andamanensis]
MSARSLPNLARQRVAVPMAIGRCKLYGDPIRSGEATVWLTRPMGLSHVECKQRADAAADQPGGA